MDPRISNLPLREREIALELEPLQVFQEHLLPFITQETYGDNVKAILGHLATAKDLYRDHPSPLPVPFENEPTTEIAFFILGSHYTGERHVVVGTHPDGWAMVFTTYLTNQIERMKQTRSAMIVGSWCRTPLPWLATVSTTHTNFRRVATFPGYKEGMRGDDLFDPWLAWSVGTEHIIARRATG